ncbi:hypothetical protein WH96_15710 [Kiloniella spongiae]|uniref:Peptidase M48 domain-containing protein n=1 Tax=Kiloniella spongiae TaxID=1489064 RepID=A0A0H2MGD7_9PROT|nr:M48 family metalloprotease [Kiloniella spongiae]KLN59827.1 hypothetical protein WH96_15710 [Kiloniella spongiae]
MNIFRGCIILLCFYVSGCITTATDNLPYFGAFDQSSNEGRYLDLYNFSDVLYNYDAEKVEKDRRIIVRDSLGLIPDDSLEQYAQSVLDKIVAVGPNISVSPKVRILANMGPGAKAMPSGDIYINHSIFVYSDNEDQLAFVLAHEYSHILLKHGPSVVIEKLRPYIMTAVDVALSQSGGEKQASNAIKLYGSDILVRDLVMPVWDKRSEHEADRLGVDLMVKAGYNPEQALMVFDREKEANEKFEASFTLERNAFEKAIEQSKNQTNNNPLNLANLVSKGLEEFQGTFASRHPEPDERKLKVFKYVQREYEEASFRNLNKENFAQTVDENSAILNNYQMAYDVNRGLSQSENVTPKELKRLEKLARAAVSKQTANHTYTRNAFANLRESQRNYRLALKNLELAKSSHGILPAAMEQDRIHWLEKTDKKQKAYERVKEVGAYYDWPLLFYKDAIRLAHELGDEKNVTQYHLSCIAKFPQSRELCQ